MQIPHENAKYFSIPHKKNQLVTSVNFGSCEKWIFTSKQIIRLKLIRFPRSALYALCFFGAMIIHELILETASHVSVFISQC
jgi:hypothetical protein